MDWVNVGKKGFFMPVLAACSSGINYALNQLVGILSTFPNMVHITIPGYAMVIVSFGVIMFIMSITDYFKDFKEGYNYPKHALVYSVSAIIGLWVFWKPLSNLYPKSLSSDAITGAIIEIIILILSASLSLYLSRRNGRI